MARQLRLAFEDACYHITSRGSRKGKFFYTDEDKSYFLELLNQTCNKYSITCYAYCLMDKHYHLFINTQKPNISQAMHFLNTSYTNWFKAKHNIVGSILQGRYKSTVVDKDTYALVLSTYIHLNPLRAGIVKDLKEYKWSSYINYIKQAKSAINRLDTEFVLNMLSKDKKQSRRYYKKYIRDNIDMKDPGKSIIRSIVLGSTEYVEYIMGKIERLGNKREIAGTRKVNTNTSKEIIKLIEKEYKISRSNIIDKKKGNIYRKLSMYLINKHTELKLQEIGKIYDLDYSAVSQSCKRFEREIKEDRKLARKVKQIENRLTIQL